MRIYTQIDAVLGPKRTFTPEGYLFCEDVPLARTGTQSYLPQELRGLPAGNDGLIHVERMAEHVFADKALRSFLAKPFTLNHPPDNLNPQTYRDHVQGVIMNPRRGTGDLADMMVGDILVCGKDAIHAIVHDGIREVSGGYTAEYEIIAPGRARQTEIMGNHVALVPKGRCGGMCAIGDQAMTTDSSVATKLNIKSWRDRARAALTLGDEKAFDAALDDADAGTAGGAVHVHVNSGSTPAKDAAKDETGIAAIISRAIGDSLAPLLARVDALEKKTPVADASKKDETADEKDAREKAEKKAKDEKEVKDAAMHYTADQLPSIIQDTIARAEIIMPGIRLAALDAKGDPRVMTDHICSQRRQTLTAGMMMQASQAVITPLLKDTPRLEAMTCDQIAVVFAAASENMKVLNNVGAKGGGGANKHVRKVGDREFSGPITPAEINAKNALAYAARKGN